MLSKEDNELLTKCGPGTPMGNFMRQYWIPGMLSTELPHPDCPPVRVRLLNENLIAFRATSGEIALVDDYCPHRGASMYFGRNEDNGLRCVYHGWKFDVTGRCVDMMNEPPDSDFKDKVRITAYPAKERNGIVWIYMGPREVPPPLPEFEANMVPLDDKPYNWLTLLNNYNWLHAIENNMDTAHNAILHHGSVTPEDAEILGEKYFEGREALRFMVSNRAPRFEVRWTDFGCTYGAGRTQDGSTWWRTMHWLFPFYSMSPINELGSTAVMGCTVPVDDDHCQTMSIFVKVGPGLSIAERKNDKYIGQYNGLPNTTDWLGRFRNPLSQEAANDFGLDREIQRQAPPTVQGFTGLRDINVQDEAMRWSQGRLTGGIVDRSREHLGATDAMIIQFRRRLLESVKALRDQGTVSPGVDTPSVYRVKSGWMVLPEGTDWWEGTQAARDGFKETAEAPILTPAD